MSRGLRVLGHPVHAALSDFPLVLLLLWVALDFAALVLVAAGLGVGGWLGGHLVFHHGVGVDPREGGKS